MTGSLGWPPGAAGLTATMPEAAASPWMGPPTPPPGTPTSARATTGTRTGTSSKLCNHIRQIQALGFEVTLTTKTP